VHSEQDYRRRAHRYLQIAKNCPDPDIADGFRAIAADYFELAGKLGRTGPITQQQQQVQPDDGAD
jgi:hypothetical protein